LWRSTLRYESVNYLHKIITLAEESAKELKETERSKLQSNMSEIMEAANGLVGVLDELMFAGSARFNPSDSSVGQDESKSREEIAADTRETDSLLPCGPPSYFEPAIDTHSHEAHAQFTATSSGINGNAPVAPPVPRAVQRTTAPPAMEGTEGSLLVVDQDRTHRNQLARRLFHEGYSVCTAEGGLAALETLSYNQFDAVILDLHAADSDGLHTLQVIREAVNLADLPVIALSAPDSPDEVLRALEAGANDVVAKPTAAPVIVARVKTQLALKQAVDFVHRTNEQLQKSQDCVSHLVQSMPATTGEIHLWINALVDDVANALELPEIGVWILDTKKGATREKGTEPPLCITSQTSHDLAESDIDLVKGKGEELERPGKLLVPAFGWSRDLFALLVVPTTDEQPLPQEATHLLRICARHIGGALEFSQVRRAPISKGRQNATSLLAQKELVQICPTCGGCYGHGEERCPLDGEKLDRTRRLPVLVAGRYRLVRLLGTGGMSTVFVAEDKRLGRLVALKAIAPAHFNNSHVRRRFALEARAIARLNHPNIVAIHDCGDLTGSCVYLVMELLNGLDLGQLVREFGPGTPQQVALFVRHASRALEAAHGAGLLHRDLKPENLLLLPQENGFVVKMVDFGLAKDLSGNALATGTDTMETRAGTVLGTPRFMAPEQARGEPTDFRSDLYALSAVTYFALTGRYLSQGKTFMEVLLDVVEHSPPPASSWLTPPLPTKVDQALARALAKNPDDRPGTIEDWLSSFIDTLETAPTSHRGWLDDEGQLPRARRFDGR
jgi:CheY-like chemotaxis protein